MLKQSNSTTKIILLYSQFVCSLYTQPSICLCLYFCFDLYLLCSIQKKDFFLCHTRYTNTTFSLSVSVQTLPFCQAHRSTSSTADVPFRGSKTYSCTAWTVKSLGHLPTVIYYYKNSNEPCTCANVTFLPDLWINYFSNSRWLKNLLLHRLE